jgi:hypothetical protein
VGKFEKVQNIGAVGSAFSDLLFEIHLTLTPFWGGANGLLSLGSPLLVGLGLSLCGAPVLCGLTVDLVFLLSVSVKRVGDLLDAL